MTLSTQSERVQIHADDAGMDGMLWLPEEHIGVILLAHAGGNIRLKPPNDYVASVLRGARLATLWLDLLASHEARGNGAHGDIGLLAERLGAACDWLMEHPATKQLPIGLIASGNCAAAALQLAALRGRGIAAIVARGGRPDLVPQQMLGKISAATLLIVGGLDDDVVRINRMAYAALRCKKRFEIIPGATQSFEEPGNLEVVARHARGWLLQNSHSAHV